MQVQDIECQLAQVQLKRYLAGESIADELLADLERHLEECNGCRSAAKVMRAAAGASNPTPSESTPEEEAKPKAKFSLGSLLKNSKATAVVRPVGEKKDNRKTLILSASLAVVLILMSTVFKDPTKLFGAKAADTVAKTEKDTPPAEPPVENIETIKDDPKADEGESEDLAGAALSASGLEETEPEPEPEVEESTLPVVNKEETEPAKETPSKPDSKPSKTEGGLNIPGHPTLQDQPVVEVGKKEPVKPAARPAANPPKKRVIRRAPRKSAGTATKKSGGNSIRIYDRNGKPVK